MTSFPVIPFQSIVHGTIVIRPYAFLDGGSTPADLALIKQLASEIPKCKYFEIGTWRGESVSNVAAVAEECCSLNLPDELLFKQTGSADYVASHRFFSRDLNNVKHLYGDSRNFNYRDLNTKFDLIFIDGDHHYDTLVQDTRNVLEILCHDASVIVWHDYTFTPESIRHETMAAILDGCPSELHPYLYHVKNTNCALLYRSKMPSVPFRKFARPESTFSMHITMNPTG
jgi:predicted O-methyltransferase YrrM